MVDSYPDVPSRRFAWDADGTVAGRINAALDSTFIEFSGSVKAEANDEDDVTADQFAGSSGPARFLVAIFPELREFDGIFYGYRTNGGNPSSVETSEDTTNGIGGTWTERIADLDNYTTVGENYRNNITSQAVSNVRAVRLQIGSTGPTNAQAFKAWHLYGDITPGETPDRLLFIDEATGLEFTAAHDYGDIPRGGSEDLEWRIKNNSASLTASTIQYTSEALYLDSGAWYTHTLPGGSTFQSTRQVASLAAATTSGLIKTRRITPGDETLGLHAGRTYLNVGTWS